MAKSSIRIKASTKWLLFSGVGAAAGVALASKLFPSAIPGRLQTGYFNVDVVAPLFFAATIGFLFGLAQWLVLRHIHGSNDVQAEDARQIWVPMTTVGVVTMVLPLLWIYDGQRAWLDIAGLPAMAPGIIVLSAAQFVLISRIFPGSSWFWRTVIGAVAGAVLGLPVSVVLQHVCHMPGEISYAGTIGLFIGALQSGSIGMSPSPSDGASGTQAATNEAPGFDS
jgi:hypothetical protein